MTLAMAVMSFALWGCFVSAEAGIAATQTTTQSQSAQKAASPATSANSSPATTQSTPGAATPCLSKSLDATGSQAPCNPAKHRKHRTPQAMADPSGAPLKKVVRNGSTAEPGVQLGPGVSQQQASQQVQLTNQLLATTDANLKTAAGRKLTPEQQETVKQIQSFMKESQAAASDGDVQRAYTLATKANLLSADLVGH
jgi:hypothetical protein